jgi:heptosyltransferase-2
MGWAVSGLVYFAYRVVGFVMGLLPLETVTRLARGVGIVVWYVSRSYRALVLRNLEIAFGSEWSPGKRAWVGRESFARLAANMVAGVWWGGRDIRELLDYVEVEGFENFQSVLDSGRGAVVVLSHTGNWELASRLVPRLFPCPTGSIYQPLSNPWMDHAMRVQRMREGMRLFDRREGFHGAIEMVRSGGLVGVLADQHAGGGGYWCPFFGRLTSTTTLPAIMAMRSGGAVLACAVYSRPNGRWKLVFRPEISVRGRSVEEWTLRINREIEAQIREQPQDWLWAHNRWKQPRSNWLLGKARRGVARGGFTQKLRLVVRSPNWLGDAVMALPAVRALKKGRPDLEVSVLAPEKLADLWRQIPEVDRVLLIPSGAGLPTVAKKLRAEKFDAALLLPNSLRVALEVWMAGIPLRFGLPGNGRSFFLNRPLRPRQEAGASRPLEHQVHHYFHLVRSIGAPVPPGAEAINAVNPLRGNCLGTWPDGVLRTEQFQVAVCPGAEFGPAKRWFPERFAGVMREVSGRFSCRWHVVGVAGDRPAGERIRESLGGEGTGGVLCENWMGRTTLHALIQLLTGCDLLLSNDTGTMHLAAILGVPVVAVFASTEPQLTGPLGRGHVVIQHRVPCGPCFLRECPLDFECMKRVSVAEVAAAVADLLEKKAQSKKSSPLGEV